MAAASINFNSSEKEDKAIVDEKNGKVLLKEMKTLFEAKLRIITPGTASQKALRIRAIPPMRGHR